MLTAQVEWLKKYHRLSNYISASMLYLKDNFLLEKPLTQENIKSRILGHWGTVPGINLIYGGLNALIKENDLENVMLITGPGHGAPAVISGLFLENTLSEYYQKATLDKEGFGYVIKQFSWPGGFPSHTYPGLPGQIHEGGELGYSLGNAFGTVLDKPEQISVCIVGDGEAETGPLAAAWQANKFLNNKTDGVVLPILHLNGYRISGPTLFSMMSDDELMMYFSGLGYEVQIVDQYKLKDEIYLGFLSSLNSALQLIKRYKAIKRATPLIILRTMKGWTGPQFLGDKKIEDNNLSHGIPLEKSKSNSEQFKLLKDWLESYQIQELVDVKTGIINEEIFTNIPKANYRIGKNKLASGDPHRTPLLLPDLNDHEVRVFKRGERAESRMVELAQYLRDIFDLNTHTKNFRLFSPDESESNMLGSIFQETDRGLNDSDIRPQDEFYSHEGRVMEMLSEHVLEEMFEAYLKTGRHGVLISYEAFLGIVTTQVDQYIKYLKQSEKFDWRKPISSLNLIATSTLWRQEHNGFSHQNPTLINSLITKQSNNVSVYFPSDVNTLLVTMEDCLIRTDSVNLIVACKRDLPQWLTLEESRQHVKDGLSIWHWAGHYGIDGDIDVVLSSAGDYMTFETLAATQILREDIPELRFQYVNVNEVTKLGFGDENNPVMNKFDFERYFTMDKSVIFNFHGYPEAIKQITWGTEFSNRLKILGFIEKGTTTTPFDMHVVNKTSRYHVVIQAILEASKVNTVVEAKAQEIISKYEKILKDHEDYIVQNGEDMPVIKQFRFKF